MVVAYKQQEEAVSGPVTITVPEHASKHTIACENVALSGTVTITVLPYGMEVAQAITDNTIDLSAPLPVYVEGHLSSIILTIDAGTFDYSVIGTAG